VGSPLRLSESAERLDGVPALGEGTESCLHELGYTDADIAQFRRDGVI
jgi:crotonobetainyl-CoA:carnitine CoA-transferase CaiB-like acyl-CoA transferase